MSRDAERRAELEFRTLQAFHACAAEFGPSVEFPEAGRERPLPRPTAKARAKTRAATRRAFRQFCLLEGAG